MFVGNSSDKIFCIDLTKHEEPASQLSKLKNYLTSGFKFVANDRPHELMNQLKLLPDYALNDTVRLKACYSVS